MTDNENRIPDASEGVGLETERNTLETGVNRKSGKKNVVNALLALVAIGVLGSLAGYYILGSGDSDEENAVAVKRDEALITKQSSTGSLADTINEVKRKQEEERLRREREEEARRKAEQEEAERLAREAQNQAEVTATISAQQPQIENNVQYDSGENQPLTPAQRRLQGDTLVQLNGKNSGGNGSNGGAIDDELKGGVYQKGSVKMVNSRNLLLIHGTQIPCVLQTRLVTDHNSIIICQVTKNIYSADGTTLLIERGSKAFGEQKKAIITGQNMAFVNWSEIDTPLGIRIRLDSLGTDSLGASGTSVWVDEKWGKRFGGAILLSLIQDGLATASQKATNTTIVYENSEANTGRMAEIALENSINIQPTGYANQGQQVNILVARDVDFSTIYRVR